MIKYDILVSSFDRAGPAPPFPGTLPQSATAGGAPADKKGPVATCATGPKIQRTGGDLLVVHAVHVLDQLQHLVGVTNFVVGSPGKNPHLRPYKHWVSVQLAIFIIVLSITGPQN